MLKKIIRLNADDLLLYLGVEGGLFLLVQIIIGCVMYFGRPETSVTVACVMFPIVGGFITLVAGISHVGVTFDQALRFGQTRRRALGLTLGVMAFEAAFALALGGVLAAVERFLCVPLWARLAGMNGWTQGLSGGITMAAPPPDGSMLAGDKFFENMAGELVPLPEKTLIIETFTLDWYWWLLIFAAAVAGGLIVGAVIQRFGPKGAWIIWGFCMAPMILQRFIPWERVGSAWLIPALAAVLAGGLLWAVWYLLHASVRS